MPEHNEGIVLLAKQPGITSFSSLWQIKNGLDIKKTGHTGTLDTFAEGLLVVLTGGFTRLVPYILECDKEYLAWIQFGSETDTLDPDGDIYQTAPLPLKSRVCEAVSGFIGDIEQVPPIYSAVHVGGKRASDRVRSGETISVPPRKVTIHDIEILSMAETEIQGDLRVSSCALRVSCSKGTYIRSLARDLALASESRAHLRALRRTRIGPFPLDKAAGYDSLGEFGPEIRFRYGTGERPTRVEFKEIRDKLMPFTPELAQSIGLLPIFLDSGRIRDFTRGIHPERNWFNREVVSKHAVFSGDRFMGTLEVSGDKLRYGFVFGGQD